MRISLTHKIAAIGLTGILGLARRQWHLFRRRRRRGAKSHRAEDISAVAKLTAATVRDMLEARRAEKDFLLRSDAGYIDRHAEIAAKARRRDRPAAPRT